MRVIAGQFKGRTLFAPKDQSIRATQERVREALFSIIGEKIHQAKVLDLFAGTGGIGIEALSRGAEHVVFVDISPEVVKRNVTGLEAEFKVIKSSVPTYLKRDTNKYDIIFMDPPWQQARLYSDTLIGIVNSDILAPTGWLICEHYKKIEIPDIPLAAEIVNYQYGDTILRIYKT